jgi:hypothetical protein
MVSLDQQFIPEESGMRKESLLSVALLGLVACGGDQAGAEADAMAHAPAVHEVHFSATDFAFEGPAEIEAGMTTFVFANGGETLHHLQLVKLPDGMSFAEFEAGLAEMAPGSPPPPWFRGVGGVNPPPPDGPATATMMVEPGEYAVLCLVDTPDRVPHVMKGMMQPLTVRPAEGPAAELPDADLTLTLVDYAFGFSEPPSSAHRTIRVTNAAEQEHEIAIFRILPGKTMDDVGAWAATYDGPAPFEAVGGVPGISPGQTMNFDVELTPGDYVALCFVPDHNDGRLHIDHGMVLPFTIS